MITVHLVKTYMLTVLYKLLHVNCPGYLGFDQKHTWGEHRL